MNTDKIYAQAIANEYSVKRASKVVALKKLDRAVKIPTLIFAYTFGIVTALVAEVGMCLSMGVLGVCQHSLPARFFPVLGRFHVREADRAYLIVFYLSGLVAILEKWLQGDCRTPPEDIIRLCMRCILPNGGETYLSHRRE